MSFAAVKIGTRDSLLDVLKYWTLLRWNSVGENVNDGQKEIGAEKNESLQKVKNREEVNMSLGTECWDVS